MKFTSISEVYSKWPNQAACIAHLELIRWGGEKAICPYCTANTTAKHKDRNRWQCWGCKKSFSVTVGTIFHNTHVDLQKWFLLISLMFSAKKGISSLQASRSIEIRQATVWSMMHRIRASMRDDKKLLAGIVEMDETYVGGKPRKKNRKDDEPKGGNKSKRGRGTDKTPIVGAIERGGRVKARPVNKMELLGDELQKIIKEMMTTRNTLLTTDEYSGYNSVNNIIAHRRINHSVGYVDYDLFTEQYGAIHTNTIESFWAIVKRAIYGQFHHVSKKYLPLYIDEIVYRFNERKNPESFNNLLHIAVKPLCV